MSNEAFKKLYPKTSNTVWNKAKAVKLVIFDVDGVFSDGRIYLGNQGEELKAFHTRDGYGIKAPTFCQSLNCCDNRQKIRDCRSPNGTTRYLAYLSRMYE